MYNETVRVGKVTRKERKRGINKHCYELRFFIELQINVHIYKIKTKTRGKTKHFIVHSLCSFVPDFFFYFSKLTHYSRTMTTTTLFFLLKMCCTILTIQPLYISFLFSYFWMMVRTNVLLSRKLSIYHRSQCSVCVCLYFTSLNGTSDRSNNKKKKKKDTSIFIVSM